MSKEPKTYRELIQSIEALGMNGVKIPKRYSHYSYSVDNGENIYLKWNIKADRKIKDDFDWSTVFKAPEPIEWYSSKVPSGETVQIKDRGDDRFRRYPKMKKSGYLKPKFRFIGMQLSGIRDYKKEYKKALDDFKLTENESVLPDTIASIDNYKETLYNQLQRQIDKAKELDNEIKRILKVFYHESENDTIKGIKEFPENKAKQRAESWMEFIRSFDHMYYLICCGADAERVSNHKVFANDFTDDIVINSTKYGVAKFVKEKQPYLDMAAKLARRIRPLEWILEDAILHGKTSTGEAYKREVNKELCKTTAKEFIGNAKNPEYPEHVIAFAMEVAINHPDITNKSELIRLIKGHENCPPEITESTNYDTFTNWIDRIDSKAGIERTK